MFYCDGKEILDLLPILKVSFIVHSDPILRHTGERFKIKEVVVLPLL